MRKFLIEKTNITFSSPDDDYNCFINELSSRLENDKLEDYFLIFQISDNKSDIEDEDNYIDFLMENPGGIVKIILERKKNETELREEKIIDKMKTENEELIKNLEQNIISILKKNESKEEQKSQTSENIKQILTLINELKNNTSSNFVKLQMKIEDSKNEINKKIQEQFELIEKKQSDKKFNLALFKSVKSIENSIKQLKIEKPPTKKIFVLKPFKADRFSIEATITSKSPVQEDTCNKEPEETKKNETTSKKSSEEKKKSVKQSQDKKKKKNEQEKKETTTTTTIKTNETETEKTTTPPTTEIKSETEKESDKPVTTETEEKPDEQNQMSEDEIKAKIDEMEQKYNILNFSDENAVRALIIKFKGNLELVLDKITE